MKPNPEIVFDRGAVVDYVLFATHGHRATYLGTPINERPAWLWQNQNCWRKLSVEERKLTGTYQHHRSPVNKRPILTVEPAVKP